MAYNINGRTYRNLEEQVLKNQKDIRRILYKTDSVKVYFLRFEGTPEIGAEVEIPIREIIDSVSIDKFGGPFPVIFTPYFLSPTREAEDVTDYYQMNLYRVDFENEIVYFSRKRVKGDGEFIIKLSLIDDDHAIYDEINQIISKDTFLATYGVTTYAEITNAVLQKKLIYCVYPDQGAFEYVYVGVVDNKRTFVAANPKGGFKVLTLTSANNWASSTMKLSAEDILVTTTGTNVQQNIIRLDEAHDDNFNYISAVADDVLTKQDKLTAGAGITIDANNVISASGGGGGIQIKTYAEAQADLNEYGKAVNYFNAGGHITYNYQYAYNYMCYPLWIGGSSGIKWKSIDGKIEITCNVVGTWSVVTN